MRAVAVSIATEVVAHRMPDRPGEVAVACAVHGLWEFRRLGEVPARSPRFDRCHGVEVVLVVDPVPFDPRWVFRLYGRANIGPAYAFWAAEAR